MNRQSTLLMAFGIIVCTVAFPVSGKPFEGGSIRLQDPLDEPEFYCFDVFNYGDHVHLGEPISVHTCKPDGWRDATFVVDKPQQGQIYMPAYDGCLEASQYEPGAHLFVKTCSASELQRFIYRENKTIEMAHREGPMPLCLMVHPGDGLPTGGPSHIRREALFLPCSSLEKKHKQWLLPEDGRGLAPTASPDDVRPAGGMVGEIYRRACSTCHGVDAMGSLTMQAPKLAGREDWYLLRQYSNFIEDIRGTGSEERWANQMRYQVQLIHRPGIERGLINYVTSLEDRPANITIKEGDTNAGAMLYQNHCSACHGAEGKGNTQLNAPGLSGMNDWYLLRQLQKFRDGLRGTHPEDTYGAQMVPSAQALRDDEALVDIVAFINTLSRP